MSRFQARIAYRTRSPSLILPESGQLIQIRKVFLNFSCCINAFRLSNFHMDRASEHWPWMWKFAKLNTRSYLRPQLSRTNLKLNTHSTNLKAMRTAQTLYRILSCLVFLMQLASCAGSVLTIGRVVVINFHYYRYWHKDYITSWVRNGTWVEQCVETRAVEFPLLETG